MEHHENKVQHGQTLDGFPEFLEHKIWSSMEIKISKTKAQDEFHEFLKVFVRLSRTNINGIAGSGNGWL